MNYNIIKEKFLEAFKAKEEVSELIRMGVIEYVSMRDFVIISDINRMIKSGIKSNNVAYKVIANEFSITRYWASKIYQRDNKAKSANLENRDRFLSMFRAKKDVAKMIENSIITDKNINHYLIVIDMKILVYIDEITFSEACRIIAPKFELSEQWIRDIFCTNKKMKRLY